MLYLGVDGCQTSRYGFECLLTKPDVAIAVLPDVRGSDLTLRLWMAISPQVFVYFQISGRCA